MSLPETWTPAARRECREEHDGDVTAYLQALYDRKGGVVSYVSDTLGESYSRTHQRLQEHGIHEATTQPGHQLRQALEDAAPEDVGPASRGGDEDPVRTDGGRRDDWETRLAALDIVDVQEVDTDESCQSVFARGPYEEQPRRCDLEATRRLTMDSDLEDEPITQLVCPGCYRHYRSETQAIPDHIQEQRDDESSAATDGGQPSDDESANSEEVSGDA